MDENLLTRYDDCVGCGVCATVCPRKAIKFQENLEGFFYPKIDYSLCIECRSCTNSCLANTKLDENSLANIKCFYGSLCNNEIESCQSGGFCSAVSRYVIEHGGTVFGVVYSDDFSYAKYCAVDSIRELEKLKGSKYIQSVPLEFETLRNELDKKKLVLVIGLPCMITAVVKWAGTKYNNLLTISLICHGPTSNLVHKKFLQEHKMGNISKFIVKGKKENRSSGFTTLISEGKRYITAWGNTDYCRLFNLLLRRSCYSCKYKIDHNYSDVIVGDFWLSNIKQNYNPRGNSSIILLHNVEKWIAIIYALKDFRIEAIDLQELMRQNPALYQTSPMNEYRAEVIEQLNTNAELKTIYPLSMRKKVINRVRVFMTSVLPSSLQVLVKNVLGRI